MSFEFHIHSLPKSIITHGHCDHTVKDNGWNSFFGISHPLSKSRLYNFLHTSGIQTQDVFPTTFLPAAETNASIKRSSTILHILLSHWCRVCCPRFEKFVALRQLEGGLILQNHQSMFKTVLRLRNGPYEGPNHWFPLFLGRLLNP